MKTITMYGPSGSPFEFTYDETKVMGDKPMSRRDHFAAAALSLVQWDVDQTKSDEAARGTCALMAKYSVILADALIQELDKP